MDISGINQRLTPEAAAEKTDNDLKKACKDFEGLLIQFMLKSMRNTLTGDCVFGDGLGKDIFQSMFDEDLSRKIANGDNCIGVGDMLYQQLRTTSEVFTDDTGRIKDALKEPRAVMTGKISEII